MKKELIVIEELEIFQYIIKCYENHVKITTEKLITEKIFR